MRSPATDTVTQWRRRRLELAGFEPPLARDLASTRAVDLHELLGLVDRGCPPHLAARILAPLDAEVRNADDRTQNGREHDDC